MCPWGVRWPDYIEQGFKSGAQIVDCFFRRGAIANRANARAELGRGAPYAVFILFDDVRHVNDTSHNIEYGMAWGCW